MQDELKIAFPSSSVFLMKQFVTLGQTTFEGSRYKYLVFQEI